MPRNKIKNKLKSNFLSAYYSCFLNAVYKNKQSFATVRLHIISPRWPCINNTQNLKEFPRKIFVWNAVTSCKQGKTNL